jgi:hypothetical protein
VAWLEEYARQLEVNLRARIAHDFPLLEKIHVENLAQFLTMADVVWTNKTYAWLADQLGGREATEKFLDLYWPSRSPAYKDGLGRKSRTGKRQRPHSFRPPRPDT